MTGSHMLYTWQEYACWLHNYKDIQNMVGFAPLFKYRLIFQTECPGRVSMQIHNAAQMVEWAVVSRFSGTHSNAYASWQAYLMQDLSTCNSLHFEKRNLLCTYACITSCSTCTKMQIYYIEMVLVGCINNWDSSQFSVACHVKDACKYGLWKSWLVLHGMM